MKERRIWEELSRFESHDYVGKWYLRRHRRTLNSARIREVTSCFTQGREYFASATNAATSVRPLLLYYGVLSLSRGVILLLNSAKSESNLRPSHGLEVVDWQGTLASGIANVPDLRIRATSGTFGELAATRNLQSTGWWSAPSLAIGTYYAEYPMPRFVGDDSEMTLDDLLSRDNRFLSLYTETTGRPSRVHLGEIVADKDGLDVSIFSWGHGISQAIAESRFGLPSTTKFQVRSATHRLPIENYYVRLQGSDLNALKLLLPATQYVGGDGMFVMEDFSNGDRLSELLRTFLLSYFLGMLVRYFPSRWISLLRNEKGDVAQPLLIAAVNAVGSDYPTLVVGSLS